MNDAAALTETAPAKTENFDVVIVGAGISGIGGAYHLTKQCPGTRFVVLEIAGELRRHVAHPPLSGHPFRQRPLHLRLSLQAVDEARRSRRPPRSSSYMGEVIEENDLGRHIRYRHQITSASWSSTDNLWTIEAARDRHRRDGALHRELPVDVPGILPAFGGLHAATGTGMEPLQGPDRSPADLAGGSGLHGKKVVVIGSGATAATLIPAIAAECGHVTMLQRSPTYFIPARNADELADTAARTADRRDVDPRNRAPQDPARPGRVHPPLIRASRRSSKQELIAGVRAHLGPDYDMETHFTPSYRPWRQRIAFVPDGDLFKGIRSGKASVVTDEIERFTETGILLKSGEAARGRHHRHRDRVPSQRTGRHRLHHRRQAARCSPIR